MQPTVNPAHIHPWKTGPGLSSLLEVSWKNALRWLVVALLLLFGTGFISAGARHFGTYRKLRLACQQGQVPLPSYEQATSNQYQPNHPPATCLRRNQSMGTVSLECSCYSGVAWASGCAFTALGVLLLLFIMLALTDQCCCCFRQGQPPRPPVMNNPPAAYVVGIPAGMSPITTGYSMYGAASGMNQLSRTGSINMRPMYPMQGAMHTVPYGHAHYNVHDHALNSHEMFMTIPVSTHPANIPMDVHMAVGTPASPPPTAAKSFLPYRTIQ